MYLEGQVLEEVRRAVCLCCLCSRTGVDPHADSGGLRIWGVLGGDSQAILERCGLGLDGRGNGSCEVSSQAGRRECPLGEALGKVQSESPGRHRERLPIAWADLGDGQWQAWERVEAGSTWRLARYGVGWVGWVG